MDEEVEAVNNRVEEEKEEVFQESCSVFEVSGTNYMKKIKFTSSRTETHTSGREDLMT